MANDGIAKAFIAQFEDEVLHLAQQEMVRLRGTTRERVANGETYNFERLGATATIEKTTRHLATPVIDMPHTRRVATQQHWVWATLVDEQDEVQVLINPRNEYAKNCAMSMARQWDDLIITAAFGTSTDGDGGSVTFPSGQEIDLGATGRMTVTALLQAKELLDANDVDDRDRCLVIGSRQLRDLLSTTEITSSDYTNVKALVNGQINDFLGFSVIRSERLPLTTTFRDCLAFQKEGIALWVGLDRSTRIDQRRDLSYAWQVFSRFSATATRLEEERVVKIICDEV